MRRLALAAAVLLLGGLALVPGGALAWRGGLPGGDGTPPPVPGGAQPRWLIPGAGTGVPRWPAPPHHYRTPRVLVLPAYQVVWVPASWHWDGWRWLWVPGYWAYVPRGYGR